MSTSTESDKMTTKIQTPVAEEDDDAEDLEKLQEEIARMEEEAARIARQTEELQNKSSTAAGPGEGTASSATEPSAEGSAGAPSAASRDAQSIYVGQVDYSATPEELLAHFEPCGVVERVTICCDKMTGRPKGFAYLEFQNEEAVENALKLDGSTFKDRTLKVSQKRVNEPGYNASRGRGGGRFGRGGRGGRGRGGRGYRGRAGYRGGRGGGGYEGGGGYHPYY
mmetsp:Transcript_18777/g.27530  ORF Transcript_18777/g.27530 Transcript_18777/m.27530 type:complete len:224 (-) Transcript_18777:40-711(-)